MKYEYKIIIADPDGPYNPRNPENEKSVNTVRIRKTGIARIPGLA